MIVLGLDPGIARTGFGVINTAQSKPFVQCGCLTTPANTSTPDRLHTIGSDLNKIISRWQPDRAVVETVLFGTNAKTAMLTAETRGVLLYVLRHHHITVHSLTPLQIKSRLTGYGAADKQQIQYVVTQRLNLDQAPQPDDAADALAAALSLANEPISVSNPKPAATASPDEQKQ